MRYKEFITENKVSLNDLYKGNFPDRNEMFWDYARSSEFDELLTIKPMPKHLVKIMLQDQYRVEHIEEILDMMDQDQKETLEQYMSDPNLSNKVIVIAGDKIIDGNHRALAAAIKNMPINYVDLSDLENLDEMALSKSKTAGVSESKEQTTKYYNLMKWLGAAKKHKLIVTKGQMAGTKGVKIYDADSLDQKSGGRFFSGPGWNYGHLTIMTDDIDEMALSTYQPMGDFNKPGPFRGPDKKLVVHPVNQLKTQQFFEKTPYDFRLFFSNIPGTGKYSEYGPMKPETIKGIFKDQADQIINNSEDSITVVFVGNAGDSKVPLTPWLMAHRFGHAIQAGVRTNNNWNMWREAEKHFFTTVNSFLEEYYGKYRQDINQGAFKWNMTPEYNALFNAIGTQRSSRTNQIKRPYEFLYELFAQYLGTGNITLNALPTNLGYGRKAWGTPTKYLNIKPEYRDENTRKEAAEMLARDMELMFDDVLSSSVGKIFIM